MRTSVSIFLSPSLHFFLFLFLLLSSSLFLPAATAANGITRIPHFKRRFIHPTSAGWDELTIDRIDTVSAGEPRVRLGWKRVFRPRPSPLSSSRNCIRPLPAALASSPSIPRSFTPLSLFSITRLLRREGGWKRIMWRDRRNRRVFLCDLKIRSFPIHEDSVN